MLTPNFAALKKIRLFGIQIYSNVLYLYSLSKQTEGFYVFVLEARLPIPSNGALLPYQVPSFMGRLWNIGMLLNSSHKRIDIFFEESAERDIDSSSFSSTNCEVIRKKSRVE
ncbi:hypothetical protein A0J61_10815 [Choanephora cucurbitarum]|uniref:Uncharacterized protein n=1 Tax=Choanephora cucurbitarum TaxID=101091 RepID=A0A1C7MXI5_9FUNG|nr:hypothetical protein A0J61_10815 [Choanephora cucurbitarum]